MGTFYLKKVHFDRRKSTFLKDRNASFSLCTVLSNISRAAAAVRLHFRRRCSHLPPSPRNMATMIRGMSLREAMIRPAMSYSRGLARRKRSLCTSTTKTTPSPVVSPPARSPSIDTADATTEEGNPTCGGPSSRKRMEWRPSEVHRASATSLRRKEVRSQRTVCC